MPDLIGYYVSKYRKRNICTWACSRDLQMYIPLVLPCFIDQNPWAVPRVLISLPYSGAVGNDTSGK